MAVVNCQPVARASCVEPRPCARPAARDSGRADRRPSASRGASVPPMLSKIVRPSKGKASSCGSRTCTSAPFTPRSAAPGQRRLDRRRGRPGSPRRRPRARMGHAARAPRRAVIGRAHVARQRLRQPQQLHLAARAAAGRRRSGPPARRRGSAGPPAPAPGAARGRALVGRSLVDGKPHRRRRIDPEHHALRRLPFLLAHEMRVRPARAAPVDPPRLVARMRRAVLPELVAHARRAGGRGCRAAPSPPDARPPPAAAAAARPALRRGCAGGAAFAHAAASTRVTSCGGVGDDVAQRLAPRPRREGQRHAVGQDRLGHRRHVLGRRAPAGRRAAPAPAPSASAPAPRAGPAPSRRSARTGSGAVGIVGAAGAHQVEDHLDHRLAHRHPPQQRLRRDQLVGGEDLVRRRLARRRWWPSGCRARSSRSG